MFGSIIINNNDVLAFYGFITVMGALYGFFTAVVPTHFFLTRSPKFCKFSYRLRKGMNIVVATPGRLVDHLQVAD